MNGWFLAAVVLLAAVVPLGWTAFRRPAPDGLVALELAGVLVTLVLVVLAQGFQRGIYVDLALVLAALQLVGGLVFTRALERGA